MPEITLKDIKSAISNAGYDSSQAHHEPTALKTNAPDHVLWDIMRSYCKLHPPIGSKHREERVAAKKLRNSACRETSGNEPAEKDAGELILSKEPSFIADFTISSDLRLKFGERQLQVARFPSNPGIFTSYIK